MNRKSKILNPASPAGRQKLGFSLIELMVVMGIIVILSTVSLFALQGSRQQGRDTQRKSEIETIRSGLELYKSDCGSYPASLTAGSPLNGNGSTSSCAAGNIYIASVPGDPLDGTRIYVYRQITNTTYALCALLEQVPNPAMTVTDCSANCDGSTACNYITRNP